jgi:hypothetical protein
VNGHALFADTMKEPRGPSVKNFSYRGEPEHGVKAPNGRPKLLRRTPGYAALNAFERIETAVYAVANGVGKILVEE